MTYRRRAGHDPLVDSHFPRRNLLAVGGRFRTSGQSGPHGIEEPAHRPCTATVAMPDRSTGTLPDTRRAWPQCPRRALPDQAVPSRSAPGRAGPSRTAPRRPCPAAPYRATPCQALPDPTTQRLTPPSPAAASSSMISSAAPSLAEPDHSEPNRALPHLTPANEPSPALESVPCHA